MSPPKVQTAIVQTKDSNRASGLNVGISHTSPVQPLPSPHHVLVRVLAVGLNPTDWKMVTHFYMESNVVGCDFCGIVEEAGAEAQFQPGTRVCGADFPYRPNNPHNGAFSQWCVADSRQMVQPPSTWSDTQAAALGAIGWGTVCMALADPDALNLPGTPSHPAAKPLPVLVYGGATATGVIAIQALKASGYDPIAVCSPASAPFVTKIGASGTASYTSPDLVQQLKTLAGGRQYKHVLDCITDAESAEACFAVIGRLGGRYACLEHCPEEWQTRKTVKVKMVMGFEMLGNDVDLGHPSYSRAANTELHQIGTAWATEVQTLLDKGLLVTQAIQEVPGGFEGILNALDSLQSGEVKGKKLVIRIPASN